MSPLLEQQKYFLLMLLNSKSVLQARKLLATAGKDQFRAIFELCANVLHFNIPINGHYKNRLKPHANILMQLADKSIDLKQKTRICLKRAHVIIILLKASRPKFV